ncbi:hypothetical protein [Allorhizobium taibaishanense]|uniref:Uncharacterized protein n=1 Tax=Allorhizobium taibaishanense TaxID=887144 RepID=A0A1Q9A7T8_9HYPH|nr:hypothetical protein [Allorhizobium taibaishanense]MBB4008802.1 hypothetical protein [Allorhizobium taibaishanense]OLP50633.1 hypothetical protein BJF91_12125 [Allorhizobium taibaishanense]
MTIVERPATSAPHEPNDQPLYEVCQGETVTAWLVSPLIATSFPGEPAPAEDRADYRFINGFVDVGDLPCRKAFWATMVGRLIAPEWDWPVDRLNLPGANRRVEFTHFWHGPTHVRRWLRGTFKAPMARSLALRLKTCGGVRIWVNGVEQVRFEPFRRNVESATDIVLTLSEGDNDILVHTEDLAERDTVWFVELEVTDQVPVAVQLPAALDAETIDRLEGLIRSVRPARDVFVNEPLQLLFDEAAPVDVPVEVRVYSHGHDRALLVHEQLVLGAGESVVTIPQTRGIADGYHGIDLRLGEGVSTAGRVLDAAFISDVSPKISTGSLAERKREALVYSARHGAPRIGRVLAMAASGEVDEAVLERLITDTLASIDRRDDCSDFIMVPLLWLLGAYPNVLSEDLLARVRQSVLNYRYWVDEPGNDVMWFWSENHVLCFHTSQLLAGQLFPDAVFSASGRTGTAQAALARHRLHRWFDSSEAHGLAEWNSAAYYPIDFIGLLALEHWAEPEIAARARGQLDLIFRMIALHTLAGVPAGSQGRAYDKELRAGPLTELAPFAYVAFGEGWLNGGVASLPMFCASDYQPPADLAPLARLEEGRRIEARYAQGLEAGRLTVFKTEASQLSTVVDHKTGTKGHQQHVLDIRLAGHPMARLWINHPGEDDPWGSQRPSYWAGNGILPRVAQHGDTALLIADTAGGRMPFTHAYLGRDGLDEVLIEEHWVFVRAGRGFAALYNSHGLELQESGATAGRELRSMAPLSGWVAVVGSGQETDFPSFCGRLKESVVTFDAEARTLSLTPSGGEALTLSYDGMFRLGTRVLPFRHDQPQPVMTYDSNTSDQGEIAPLFY